MFPVVNTDIVPALYLLIITFLSCPVLPVIAPTEIDPSEVGLNFMTRFAGIFVSGSIFESPPAFYCPAFLVFVPSILKLLLLEAQVMVNVFEDPSGVGPTYITSPSFIHVSVNPPVAL